ncbi:MAG: biotin/lipoate A/B protein ligase family protein [Negativicutes bacterium]|nr:biotin/lipoate A/B protein ligase family protein [Negativicutes bacterium]
MKWRLLDSGLMDAAANMAVDEAILAAHAAGAVPPTLRFYGWRPAAVSLGYFQKAAQEVDLAECQARGVDVIRRLTGGRAVLHDAELTYSIIVRENHPLVPPTITASYRYFSGGLLAGLQQMGLDARMSIPRAAYGQGGRKAASAACFDAPSHYEITVGGRKLVGSAQVRKSGVILQHGSVLLRFSAEDVVALLQLPSPELRSQLVEMLGRRATSVEEALGRPITWQELCGVMAAAFGPALGVELEAGGLTAEELAESRRLAAEKYSQDSWNLLR